MRRAGIYSGKRRGKYGGGVTIYSLITLTKETPLTPCRSLKQFGLGLTPLLVDGKFVFNEDTLAYMEHHVSKARKARDELQFSFRKSDVPWADAFEEATLSYDVATFNFERAISDCLGVRDLTRIDKATKDDCVYHLLDETKIKNLHKLYHRFILEVVAPSLPASISTFKYQNFPCLRLLTHSEFSLGIHCDALYGHPCGSVNYILPVTPENGAQSLHIESSPGKEDWHSTGGGGLGILRRFWGAMCLHFTGENWSGRSRVSLDFRIIPGAGGDGGELYDADENYYEIARRSGPESESVWRSDAADDKLKPISRLTGFPFSVKKRKK